MADKYLTVAETAKLVRKALAEKYPSQKFSVRSSSYSGGASIDVRWVDGPTTKMIKEIVGKFAGASFDPMIDLKSYHDSVHPETGERVSFGADYVFEERSYTVESLRSVAQEIAKQYGMPVPGIVEDGYEPYLDKSADTPLPGSNGYIHTLRDAIMREIQERSFYKATKVSKTEEAKGINGREPMLSHKVPANGGVKRGEYKGHPTITLPLASGQEFTFGIEKARAILANLEALRDFVDGK